MEELHELAQTAWEEFRARYHASLAPSTNGGDGSMVSGGNGILQVRSASHRVAGSILSVTELLNGSGDLPDTDALLSCAERGGLCLEDFTCMVLSLMYLMDGLYSMHSGKTDMAVQHFAAFMNAKAQHSTSESMPSKTRGQTETMQYRGLEDHLKGGDPIKNVSTSSAPRPKKRKLVKGSGMPLTSGRRRAPPKK